MNKNNFNWLNLTPNILLKHLISKVTIFDKMILCSVFFIGFISHGIMLTNKISFHDDVHVMFGIGETYMSGRWFLGILSEFWNRHFGLYSLPLVNGIISFLFIALSACILFRIFQLSDLISCFMICSLMVVFPVVTSTFAYMFTAGYYFFSVFLMFLAAILTIKYKRGGFIGILLIACSLGIYQAYFSIIATLFIMDLIIKCMDENTNTLTTFKEAIKYFLTLLSGLILYLFINKIIINYKGLGLSSYQGINNIGTLSIIQLFEGIKKAYANYLSIISTDYLGLFHNGIIHFCIILSNICFLVISIWTLLKLGSTLKKLQLFLYILLFPLAINFIEVMCAGNSTTIHTLMVYSVVFIFIWPFLLLEKIQTSINYKAGSLLNVFMLTIGKWFVIISTILTILFYIFFNNEAYLKIQLLKEQCNSYFTTLITHIKSTDGYDDNLPLAFIGINQDHSITDMPAFSNIEITAYDWNLNDWINDYAWQEYMALHCGYKPEIVEDTTQIASWEQVKHMDYYPNSNSIKIVDGIIVIKFSS
ncbi:hypothetical protein CE91St54_09770 [Hungatella hathewayi]|uniref:Glucosyl transferase GtrII n=2 Tax=Lachnospiraceae TaxID=186803 RepID=A0AA37JHY0_9FIRM|nr:hypothetical protein CE91St55_10270 [Hungatella hathewayi]GKH05869.1 hypothetical protein CE91St54_09770 [Hungatella hathewayi]